VTRRSPAAQDVVSLDSSPTEVGGARSGPPPRAPSLLRDVRCRLRRDFCLSRVSRVGVPARRFLLLPPGPGPKPASSFLIGCPLLSPAHRGPRSTSTSCPLPLSPGPKSAPALPPAARFRSVPDRGPLLCFRWLSASARSRTEVRSALPPTRCHQLRLGPKSAPSPLPTAVSRSDSDRSLLRRSCRPLSSAPTRTEVRSVASVGCPRPLHPGPRSEPSLRLTVCFRSTLDRSPSRRFG